MPAMGLVPDPRWTLQVLQQALRSTGRTGVLLTASWPGWAAAALALGAHPLPTLLSPDPPPTLTPAPAQPPLLLDQSLLLWPGTVPHGPLLKRCAALLHHGGSGTTCAALHCGIPQIMCPFMFDQFYHAERAAHLGLAPPPLPRSLLLHPPGVSLAEAGGGAEVAKAALDDEAGGSTGKARGRATTESRQQDDAGRLDDSVLQLAGKRARRGTDKETELNSSRTAGNSEVAAEEVLRGTGGAAPFKSGDVDGGNTSHTGQWPSAESLDIPGHATQAALSLRPRPPAHVEAQVALAALRVAAALHDALRPSRAEACLAFAQELQREDGVATAVAALEALATAHSPTMQTVYHGCIGRGQCADVPDAVVSLERATWLRLRSSRSQVTDFDSQVGRSQVHLRLSPDMTVQAFLALISEKTGIAASEQEVMAGYPPRQLQLPTDVTGAFLSSLPLANGDTITLRAKATAPATAAELGTAPANGVSSSSPSLPPPPPYPATGQAAITGHYHTAAAPAAASAAAGSRASPAPAYGDADDADPDLAAALAASLASSLGHAGSGPGLPGRGQGQGSRQPGPPPPATAAAAGGQQGSSQAGPAAGHKPGPAPTSVALPDGSAVTRRVIDSDNSCLFNALLPRCLALRLGQVGYVMEGSRHAAPRLRKVIADTVRADPVTYNEAFLAKPNEQYCRQLLHPAAAASTGARWAILSWILGKDKWGGAIELSILAAHFGREIAAYDIQTKRCDLYGQDAGYSERVMLLYDGLHYDSLAVAAFEGAPEELDTRILDLSSPRQLAVVEEGATKLVAACHDARMFTNTASFTLRCGVCQVGLKGEREAVDHAKFTGHQNFTEY
ncbi:hypothetical protein QJQ45_001496 [Haematococcus lacustris]|nr:hypothetical protein QJQ45_001496 [Haematococcus lacustris]